MIHKEETMRKKIRKLLCISTCFIVLTALIGCTIKPDTTINNLFDALKKSDIQTASKYLSRNDSASVGGLKFDRPEYERLAKLIFSKLSYQVISSNTSGDTAVAKTKITSPDLNKISGKMVTDLFPGLYSKALNGEQLTQDKINQLIEQYYTKNLNESSVPTVTNDVDIKLVKNKDKNMWLIEPNENLANAITGNLFKAFNPMTINNSTSISKNSEGKLYEINEEARIGNTSITITKFQKSFGDDYIKAGQGNEFIIVTLKEKNIGGGNIDYNEAFYQLQNSKGQIKSPAPKGFNRRLDSGSLVPGGEVDGTVTFEVPRDDPQLSLIYNQSSKPVLKFRLNY